MNKLFFTIAASAALAACDQADHTIVAGGGKPDAEVVNTVGVVLPPAISASKTYRCKDNSLVYIDWLSDFKSANFRAAQTDAPTHLTAANAGELLVAEGYSLKGDPTAKSITLERPGKSSQTCNA